VIYCSLFTFKPNLLLQLCFSSWKHFFESLS
jgi:hypothetical protein